jgi:hypothetical protein
MVVILLPTASACLAGGLYETSHDVMVETIRLGQASGVMGGDMAKKFSQQFNSDGTLLFESKRLYLYKQPGCARVAIDYTKKGVATPNGLQDVKLNTQINYCLDGRAPQSLEIVE